MVVEATSELKRSLNSAFIFETGFSETEGLRAVKLKEVQIGKCYQ